MKKVKFLLIVILIMSIVGGVSAFKSKIYTESFCTRQIADGAGVCQGSYSGRIAFDGDSYYYTTTDNNTKCDLVQCTSTTFLTSIIA
jgi:hypothetical protein